MCGIVGVLGSAEDPAIIRRMTAALTHRGPDEQGYWTNNSTALGIARLSVIDLAGGHQPMQTADGRHVIVYNGETYNFRELRLELQAEGVYFRTDSDTEVILLGVARHGPGFIERLRGMFVFAFHDRVEGSTLIVRDRLGVKPLYMARAGGRFLFASEIKALLEHPALSVQPDIAAVSDYMALRYVPGPRSLFQGVEKFPTASWMLRRSDGSIRVHCYWEPPIDTEPPNDSEVEERFAQLFDEATRNPYDSRPSGGCLSQRWRGFCCNRSISKQAIRHAFADFFGWFRLETGRTGIGCTIGQAYGLPAQGGGGRGRGLHFAAEDLSKSGRANRRRDHAAHVHSVSLGAS